MHFINRSLLSEFEELEAGVVEHHTQLSARAGTENRLDSHQSLQSLSDSFEELQQRYKQLKDDSARKLKVSTCTHKSQEMVCINGDQLFHGLESVVIPYSQKNWRFGSLPP